MEECPYLECTQRMNQYMCYQARGLPVEDCDVLVFAVHMASNGIFDPEVKDRFRESGLMEHVGIAE